MHGKPSWGTAVGGGVDLLRRVIKTIGVFVSIEAKYGIAAKQPFHILGLDAIAKYGIIQPVKSAFDLELIQTILLLIDPASYVILHRTIKSTFRDRCCTAAWHGDCKGLKLFNRFWCQFPDAFVNDPNQIFTHANTGTWK